MIEARRLALLASIGLAFVFASPYHIPINNPNEGVRVFMVKAIVDHGTPAINDVVKKWGYIDDKSVRDGKLYSSKAPLTSLMGAAGYAVVRPVTGPLEREALTRWARFAGCTVPSFLLLVLFARLLWRRVRDPFVGDVVVVGTALGTSVVAYVNVFSGHSIAALATGCALLLVADAPTDPGDERTRRRRLLLAGLCMATAVGAEYPALVGILPVGALLLWRQRRRLPSTFAATTLGALPVVVAVCAAHHVMFGAPWKTGYSMLENRAYNALVSQDFFGIGDLRIERLAGVLFSPEIGLFFGSPFLLAGVPALFWALRRRREALPRDEAIAIVASIVALSFFIAGYAGWRGGWSVGPRYVSELIPLFAFPAAVFFDRLAERFPWGARAALAMLVVVALLHSGLPGLFFPHLPDLLRNPVYEMVLPMLRLGFSPDTWVLWLGAPPALSAWLVVATLLLPLSIACAGGGIDRASAAALGAALALAAVVGLSPLVPGTPEPVRSLEVRRMYDNWRPLAGNPFLQGRADADPRILFGVDLGRQAFPKLSRQGCVEETSP